MKNIMVKKVLAAACALAMLPTVVPAFAAGSGLDFDDETGLIAYIGEDFESIDADTALSSGTKDGMSIYTGAGAAYTVIDDNGNNVLKIDSLANRGASFIGAKLVPRGTAINDAGYFVVKYELKNGDSASNVNTYIHHQLQFRNDGNGIEFPGSKTSFTKYEYHEFIFIGNAKTKKVRLILDGTDLGEVACNRIDSADNFFGLQIYEQYANHSYDSAMYVDNMEAFGFNLDVSCALDKNTAAVPTDKIEVEVSGYFDEASLDTVTVTSDDDADMSVASRSYSDGVLTLTLSKTMEDFTNYKVDWSKVKAKIGDIYADGSASFKTTGDLVLENSVSANDDDKLTAGVNTVTLSATNTTDIDANVTFCLELTEDGKTTAMAYKDASIGYNKSDSLCATFVAGAGATVKAYIKNSVNGVVLYGDEFTVSETGIASQKAENITDEQPTVNNSAEKGFYSLTLGTDGARKSITAARDGLIDCTADVGTGEGVLIAVVKKDGRLTDYSFAKGSGTLHAVVTADKKSTVEMYTWGDALGTSGRGEKATLGAN